MEEPAREETPRGWRAAWALAVRTGKDAHEDRVIGLGAEVAFFSLLSLPPTLLAIFASVGFIAERIGADATERIRDSILGVASTFLQPGSVEGLSGLIDTFLEGGSAGVAIFGLLLALWSASRATNVFIRAVNIAYDLPETRSAVKRRLVAFAMTILGILGAVGVLPLLVAGPRLVQWVGGPLGIGEFLATLWRYLYWPTVGVLGIALLATFYHFSPSWHTPWRRDLPGAVLAAVLWLAGAAGLRIYLALSIEGNAAYAQVATPIAVLLWVYLTSVALLLGAELNAEIERMWPTDLSKKAPSRGLRERIRDLRASPSEEAEGPPPGSPRPEPDPVTRAGGEP